MPFITFSGPLWVGPISSTIANVVGSKRNVGNVVLAQSFEWAQSTAVSTGIVIPGASQILEIALYVGETAPAGADINIGTTSEGTELGTVVITSATKVTYRWSVADTTSSWVNVGVKDVEIFIESSAGTSGRGILTVQYVQSANLAEPA